jgi:tetratricopeptide (TPR) repeat protein
MYKPIKYILVLVFIGTYWITSGQTYDQPVFMRDTNWRAQIDQFMNQQPDSIFGLLNEAEGWAKKNKQTETLAWVLKRKGTLYYYLSQNDKAIANYLQALSLYQNLKDSLHIAGMYMNLGNVAGSKKETIDFYLLSIQLNRKLNNQLGVSKNLVNVGTTFLDFDQNDSAKIYFEKALELSRLMRTKETIISSLLNLSIVYEHEGNIEKAIKSIKEALAFGVELDYKIGQVYGFYNLSQFYLRLGALDSSIYYTDQALKVAGNSFLNIQERCFFTKKTIYKQMDNYERALRYQKLKDSVALLNYTFSNEKLFSRIENEYHLALKETELQHLDNKVQLSKKLNYMLLLLIGSSVSLGGITIMLQRDRAKKEENLLKQEHAYLQSKKQLAEAVLRSAELKEKKLHSRLRHTKAHLQTFALNFAQHNETLASLKRSVSRLIKNAESKALGKDFQNFYAALHDFDTQNKTQKAFLEKAVGLYDEFLKSVEKKYPDLNANEHELLVLIALQLGHREIASIYGIKPASVMMNRYKLRKKMQVPKGESFESFLRQHIYGK